MSPKKNRQSDRKFKTLFISLLCITLLIALVYSVHYIYYYRISPYETRTAEVQTVVNTLNLQAYIVRSESVIDSPYSGSAKTVVSLISDGEKAAAGQNIAAVYNSAASAENVITELELRNKLEYYSDFSNITEDPDYDLSGLNHAIYADCNTILDCLDSGDLYELSTLTDKFYSDATKRQLATGQSVTVNEIINDLRSRLNEMDSVQSAADYITSPASGYYFAQSDGCEDFIDFESVKSLSVDDYKKINVPESKIKDSGKIVDSFKWYAVTLVPADVMTDKQIGDYLTVSFQNSHSSLIKMKIEAINGSDFGERVFVLSAMNVTPEISSLRNEVIKIRTAEYTGYKIPNNAIYELDGLKGVYVLNSNVVRFRRIDIIYSEADFSVISPNDPLDSNQTHDESYSEVYDIASQYSYLLNYDKVIIDGKGLKDEKNVK